MKPLLLFMTILAMPVMAFCQDLSGLWQGTIFNDSTGKTLMYEIAISKEKGKYSCYSHTSFVANGKQYYGIKKINLRIARDGKIIMQDDKLLDNNYPSVAERSLIQLNVLDLVSGDNESQLSGLFVTNRTKQFTELTGKIRLKKISSLAPDDLLAYFQKRVLEANLTASN